MPRARRRTQLEAEDAQGSEQHPLALNSCISPSLSNNIKKNNNPWAHFRSFCLTGDGAGLPRAQCLGKHASSSANIRLGRRQQLGAGYCLRCLRALTHLCRRLRRGPVATGLVLSPSKGFTGHWVELSLLPARDEDERERWRLRAPPKKSTGGRRHPGPGFATPEVSLHSERAQDGAVFVLYQCLRLSAKPVSPRVVQPMAGGARGGSLSALPGHSAPPRLPLPLPFLGQTL